ncbi:MAG TPA: AAA family ATPase [Candidatus Mucispirillum faecigallinarum]|uniref:AAA family ATPase n=1 Tax=Candidatus Mucispirillum faecigallinarum TaxID=2838699 RepID=A0A9D2GTJ9_9BACT|nr:AAA family ATPase [Candidatus Mucispirillum faecigallinarum]
MLKDISQLNLKGSIFDTITTLDLFSSNEPIQQRENKVQKEKVEKTVRATLIYGRNGTGKSTIAKAFRRLSDETVSIITDVNVCNKSYEQIVLSEDDKAHIFVFDEDYVYKNVKLQENHLETIVMLGKAADLTQKIEEVTLEYNNLEKEYQNLQKDFDEYDDANNIKSPKYYINKIANSLRGDDNWAGRDRLINDKRTNTSVNDETYEKFINITPKKQKNDLIRDYGAKLQELENAKKGTNIIDCKVPEIQSKYKTFNDEILVDLLKKEIEKPILSDREKKLMELLQNGKQSQLLDSMQYFQQQDVSECPFCFQGITSEYKKSLVAEIEKVLSKIVEEHQKKLKELLLEQVNIDLSPFKNLKEYNKCIDLVEKINKIIDIYSEKINKKIEDPYTIIDDIKNFNLCSLANELSEQLFSLEKARVEFNNLSQQTKPIVVDLNRINNEITYYEIKDIAEQLNKQKEEYNKIKKSKDDKYKEYVLKKAELDSLDEQRKNVKHATKSINACLQYIFFADNRMEIKYEEGVYKLLSYGKNVRPCDISAGERNILGLCYFFTNIFSNKEENKAYNEEYLIVIDDPVSSFDIENRIGILSLLKYKISKFLLGNERTRTLVLTHDIQTSFDIYKMFEEIIEACNEIKTQNKFIFNSFELKNHKLVRFSHKGKQEYTELMCMIYKYAIEEDTSNNIVIGNIMRQVLEAFATFEYKKDIARISTDMEILALLPEQEYQDYFKNLMYRLVLHGGSHRLEQVNSMSDFDFFSHISDDEKIRIAKDILCFIYLLNKRHLLRHLKTCQNVESNLNAWCNNIKSKTAPIS